MKKIYQFILTAVLIGGIAPFFSSCNEDDEMSEWNMSYVTLLPVDYLRPLPSFILKHVEEEGIEGSVDFQYVVTVQKAASQDIKVNTDVTCDGISTEYINLSSKTAVIKAGSKVSEPISVSITNWDELLNIKEAADYTLKISIAGIESTASEAVRSESYQKITLKISKTAERKKQSVLLTNAKDWIFTFMEGVENGGSNSVAGTGSNDVATNGIPFWFTVDFKEVKTLTGIQTSHWGAAYAPSKIEVFISENGREWTSLGQVETQGRVQTITFEERVKTRYLKYQMIDVPGRVDITRFYVYAWE